MPLINRMEWMRRFFQNTTLSLMGKIVGMLALMLLDIFLARKLSVDNYAEWVYFFSIVTMLFFVGWMGINASAKVGISKYREIAGKREYLQAAFLLRIFVSIVISVIIMLTMVLFSGKLGYPLKYPDLKALFFISGLMIFFNTFTELYKEVLMGVEKFKALFFLTVLEYCGYLVLVVLWLMHTVSVINVAAAYCCTGLVVFSAGVITLQHEYGLLNHLTSNIRGKLILSKEIMKYAIPLLFVGIGVVVVIEIDTFMLGMLSSKNEVAIYNIAKGLTSKAAHINYSIAVGAMTTFSLVYQDEYKSKRKQFSQISAINFVVTAIISLLMLFIIPVFIGIFYGEEYIAAVKVTRMLIPYYILYSLSTYYSTFLDFRGKARTRGIAYASIIVFDIILNYIFIPIYGAMGAAFATSISLLPYTTLVIFVSVREWKHIKEKGDQINDKSVEKQSL